MAKRFIGFVILALFLAAVPVVAHFQALVPTTDVVGPESDKLVELQVLFTHPMEGHLMNMEKPKAFGVVIKGEKPVDLLGTLREAEEGKMKRWETRYKVREPGDHMFYVEPQPYWEPAENCFIIHYTKVCVNSMGLEEGWDAEIGLKTEIVPLVRPYGLWAGNIFSGIVKMDGKPVPYAEIEVEYYNENPKNRLTSPTEAHITQVIKADGNGVFHYAMPRAGWWAFAALNTADFKLKHDGVDKDVELGAVMWVRTYEMK